MKWMNVFRKKSLIFAGGINTSDELVRVNLYYYIITSKNRNK